MTTVEGGSTHAATITTQSVIAETTSRAANATSSAGLNSSNNTGGNSGLSSAQTKIIGGVVGGIGGAALVGGIAYVLWRLYGRKKSDDDEDDLYDPNGESINKDKPSTEDPWKSNLEQHHNPGPTNTGTNF